MIAEVERVEHVDDIVCPVGVLLAQLVQQSHLDERLVMEAFLVPYDLDGDVLVRLVIESTHHLAEAALANHLEDFVAIANVIVHDLWGSMTVGKPTIYTFSLTQCHTYLIVAAIVIVVAAIQRGARFRIDFARVQSQEPYVRVFLNLLPLVLRQSAAVQA